MSDGPRGGPHRYDPDPHSTGTMLCICGMTVLYRSHQPWWWRWTHRRKWR